SLPPIADPTQTAIDDYGDTTDEAQPLAVNAPPAVGVVGGPVQGDEDGTTVQDGADVFALSLEAGKTHHLLVQLEAGTVQVTLQQPDGSEARFGNFPAGLTTLPFLPETTGTYYLKLTAGADPVYYTVAVEQQAFQDETSSIKAFSTVAA